MVEIKAPKLTPAQRRMFDDVTEKLRSAYPYLNANGGVVIQCNRNGLATARKLIELGVMVDATDSGSEDLAIKPAI